MHGATISDRLGFVGVPFAKAKIGRHLPDTDFAELIGEELRVVRGADIFARGRSVVLGVPGAFTPICTKEHLPEFIANADALRAAGYQTLVCIAPNDPWTVRRWASELDPEGKIRFLSDGNLALAIRMGLTTHAEDFFLRETSRRYLMTLKEGVVDKLKVEADITTLGCTRTETILLDA